ncbi:MAG: hypothetical protein GY793_03375 [Proteobacteria bacterium]|nr:hypothetical protein [Pseudomonadota bacterium]
MKRIWILLSLALLVAFNGGDGKGTAEAVKPVAKTKGSADFNIGPLTVGGITYPEGGGKYTFPVISFKPTGPYTKREIIAAWDLPEYPSPAINDQTQEGVDVNGRRGRDDVELWAGYYSYPDEVKFKMLTDLAAFHRDEIVAYNNNDGRAYFEAGTDLILVMSCYHAKYDVEERGIQKWMDLTDGLAANRGFQTLMREAKMSKFRADLNPKRVEIKKYCQGHYSNLRPVPRIKTDKDIEIKKVLNLPPEPDPVENNMTVEGIDSNRDGSRDDIERQIAFNYYPDRIMIKILTDVARSYREMIKAYNNDNDAYLKYHRKMRIIGGCYYRRGGRMFEGLDEVLVKLKDSKDRKYQDLLMTNKIMTERSFKMLRSTEMDAYCNKHYPDIPFANPLL